MNYQVNNSNISPEKPLLTIQDLRVYYEDKSEFVKAVDGVSMDIFPGDSIGLVGESGCGKSTLGFSIINLLKGNKRIPTGKILFRVNDKQYVDIVTLPDEYLNNLRGKYVSMVFQAAQDALNPLQNIKNHFFDTLEAHNFDKKTFVNRIKEIFGDLDIPYSRLYDYPFQFSGGMQQRLSIALALILEPKLVICDEPTTALDVLVQAKIISLLKRLKERKRLSLIFISHDLGVISQIATKVAVMYAGKLVEFGSTDEIFKNPQHPYTIGLMNSIPNILEENQTMKSIPGSPPDLKNPPTGCRFNPRCSFAKTICIKEEPEFRKINSFNHLIRCHIGTSEYEKSGELANNE